MKFQKHIICLLVSALLFSQGCYRSLPPVQATQTPQAAAVRQPVRAQNGATVTEQRECRGERIRGATATCNAR